jgi:hypothetical protein
MPNETPLAGINKAWESTCKIMLGRPIGSIDKYDSYLQKFVTPASSAVSYLSKNPITISGDYAKGAKFIAGDEAQAYFGSTANQKLDINSIKDFDSIIDAVRERICYSGSDVLGNSSNVHSSNRVVDSNYIYKAHDVFYSKYISHTYLSKYSEYIFGCESVGKNTHFAIKAFETYEDSRLFECVRVYMSSDCLFSANLENCTNCLFSFNLRSKRNCIGNLELAPSKFTQLKAKLQEDISSTLEAKRTIPSIVEIIGD